MRHGGGQAAAVPGRAAVDGGRCLLAMAHRVRVLPRAGGVPVRPWAASFTWCLGVALNRLLYASLANAAVRTSTSTRASARRWTSACARRRPRPGEEGLGLRIDHVALCVRDLEAMRAFYCRVVRRRLPGRLYHNPRTGLRTYFAQHFDGGARVELMRMPGALPGGGEPREGWAHLSFSLGSREAVDAATGAPARGGSRRGERAPRVTGDGYYESCVLDPEGNRVELVAELGRFRRAAVDRAGAQVPYNDDCAALSAPNQRRRGVFCMRYQIYSDATADACPSMREGLPRGGDHPHGGDGRRPVLTPTGRAAASPWSASTPSSAPASSPPPRRSTRWCTARPLKRACKEWARTCSTSASPPAFRVPSSGRGCACGNWPRSTPERRLACVDSLVRLRGRGLSAAARR